MKSSIRSGSGMQESAAHLIADLIVGPVGMLRTEEGRLVVPHRPLEPMSGLPTFRRGHPPQDLHLFRAELFVREHMDRLGAKKGFRKPPAPSSRWSSHPSDRGVCPLSHDRNPC